MFPTTKRYVMRSLALLPLLFLGACKTVVMNPSGDIARQQADLIVISTVLMLLIIVPVIALTCLFAWRYRQGNTGAKYEPDWDHSTKLELVIWGAPLLIIIVLGMITWTSTHLLDPYRPLTRISENKPLAKDVKPLEVQVVALDWKWLFIYPEQGIATVNEFAAPMNVPVRFKISSSTVMNSFYIPAMAGQIYAMPGMETTLNAVMNEEGQFEGFSANYSGAGFSDMRFAVRSLHKQDFDAWVRNVQKSNATLDNATYTKLEAPSEKDPVRYFGNVGKDLFYAVVNRCVQDGEVCMDKQMAQDHQRIKVAGARYTAPKLSALTEQPICSATQVSLGDTDTLLTKARYVAAN